MVRSLIKGSFSFLMISNVTIVFSTLVIYLNGKLLTPEDFGLIGLATILISFLDSFKQIGTKEYLISHGITDDNEVMNAWTLDLCKSVILFILCLALTPLVSSFYGIPSLLWVIPLLSLGFLFDGLSNPYFYKLRMNLEYKKLNVYNLLHSSISSLFIICLVYYFQDYRGVIIGYFFRGLFQFAFTYLYNFTVPYLYFRNEIFKKQFHYGKWVLICGVLYFFTGRFDVFVVSNIVTLEELGFYSFALSIMLGIVVMPLKSINNALFPLLSKNVDDLKVITVIKLTSAIALVVIILSFTLIQPVLQLMFSGKWNDAILTLQLLCAAAAVNSVRVDGFFMSTGNTKIKFKIEAVRAFSCVILLYPLVNIWGIEGAAISLILANVIGLLIWCLSIKKLQDDKVII
ncbi:MAG: O-antigen/teichoic acid export membrane protein [Alteromonadaceae bacterium]|jgi:O-antigen/teichoic acid export membrane protein